MSSIKEKIDFAPIFRALKRLFFYAQKCNKVQQEKKFVAVTSATRKKFVALFAISRCTPKPLKKPYSIKAFITTCNNCNNCNNDFKKYLGSWRNRLFLQEYRVLKKSALQLLQLLHPNKNTKK